MNIKHTTNMDTINIGDTVRFLNDIGGGKVTAFKPGGIVLVQDEDGFDMPVPASEVVVVETDSLNIKKKTAARDAKRSSTSSDEQKIAGSMTGKEYLKSKAAPRHEDEEDETDENLEARVLRLEMSIRKLEMRLARLEDSKAAKEKEKILAKQAKKKSKDDILEIDLHANEILETTAGMSPAHIKDYQMQVFNDTMQAHISEKGFRIIFIHGKGDGVLRKAIIDELKYKYKSCDYQDASFQQYGFGATMVTIH